MILGHLESDKFAIWVELHRCGQLGILVQHDQLVQVGELTLAMHSHSKLFDARGGVPDPHQLKWLALIDTLEEGRLDPVLKDKLDGPDARSVSLAEPDLLDHWEFLQV